MSTTEKLLIVGTETTVISAAAISNNQNAISSTFNNTIGSTGDGSTMVRIKISITMGVGATANTGLSLYILKSSDAGSTFEDGATGTGYTPLRMPDLVCPAPVDTTNRTLSFDRLLPAGQMKFLPRNEGTGQSMSSVTITVLPITRSSV